MNPTNEQPTTPSPEQTPNPQFTTTPPVAPQQPAPVAPQGTNPGKALAIVGLILGFIGLSLIGLILSIVAKVKSSKAGFKNTLAVVGIILNSIFLILTPFLLAITLVAYSNVQARAKDSATYSELTQLNKEVLSYLKNNLTKPSDLSEVATAAHLDNSVLTDADGNAYQLTWEPEGCSSLSTCTGYTLSGDSAVHKGEKVSISVDGATGKTTSTNKPTSSE